MRIGWVLAFFVATAAPSHAQMVDDSLMVPRKAVFTGVFYGHDTWTKYWEGTLKRENENVGRLTTQNVSWVATYGLFDQLNVMVSAPYVSAKASGGTLHSQSGLQDFTLGVKGRLPKRRSVPDGACAPSRPPPTARP
jgi:hypothetical protein